MKKFYESPVVELTGFSAEDVITLSAAGVAEITVDDGNAAAFAEALNGKYDNVTGYVINATTKASTSYQW